MTGPTRDYRLAPTWRVLLIDLGIQPSEVLRVAGLPSDMLTQKEVHATADDFFALWNAAESLCPGVELPLEVAKRTSAETFTPELFAALCSPNAAVALDRLSTYKQLCAPVRMELTTDDGGSLTTTLRWLGATQPTPASMSTMELAFMVRIVRMGIRQPVGPVRVSLPERPANLGPYEAYFGVPIETGTTAAITFDADVLQRPFLTSSDELWRAFEPNLRQRLATLQATSTTRERVRGALLESLPSGSASVAEIASRLGLSARTLQRRLRTEGASFNAVLAEVREELARHYLANTDLPCGEIAFLLGYEEPNSFFRAFHNWTGESPQRHRQAAGIQPGM